MIRQRHSAKARSFQACREACTFACGLLLVLLGCSHAFGQSPDEQGVAWKPAKSPADFVGHQNGAQQLLEQLRARDAFLDGRTLQIHKRWIEHVNPLSQRLAGMRVQRRIDAKQIKIEELPAAFDQPHRVHYQITQRGREKTVRVVGDLEKRIHKEFGQGSNAGYVWTNVGDCAIGYSPLSKIVHKQDAHDYAAMPWAVRSFRWACGFGFSPFITEAKSIQQQDERTVFFGRMTLLEDDDTGCTLHLDQDWIVRKAVMMLPSKPNGTNDYVVVTEGTKQDVVPMALTGHYRRILRPVGKKFRIYEDYHVDFVDISKRLSNEDYLQATKLLIPEDATTVDIRSVLRPK